MDSIKEQPIEIQVEKILIEKPNKSWWRGEEELWGLNLTEMRKFFEKTFTICHKGQ